MGYVTRYKSQIALVSIASSMAVSIFTMCRWGLGTSPDSVVYIAGARSIASGQGFTLPSITGDRLPIVQFPPIFSVILSLFTPFGFDPLEGAWILNAALFAVNIYFTGLLVYRATKSAVAGYITAALIMSAPAIVTTHTMVWTEPLFLFLVLISAFAIMRYLEAPRWSSVLGVLPAVVVAPMARYIGVTVILAATVTIARRGIYKHAIACAIVGSFGIAAWLVRNYASAADLTSRKIVFHTPTADHLALASQTVLEWFGGMAVAALFFGLIVITYLRRPPDLGKRDELVFLGYFALAYVIALTVSLFFIDAHTPLDRRILSPLYIVLSLAAVVWIVSSTGSHLRFAWTLLLLLIVSFNAWTSISWLNILSTHGIGFGSSVWRHSPTMNYVRKHRATSLHTNAPDAVLLHTGKLATMLPSHADPGTLLANPEYTNQVERVRSSGGIVVYFRAVTWRWYLPPEDRLRVDLGLVRIADLGDGAVYSIAGESR